MPRGGKHNWVAATRRGRDSAGRSASQTLFECDSDGGRPLGPTVSQRSASGGSSVCPPQSPCAALGKRWLCSGAVLLLAKCQRCRNARMIGMIRYLTPPHQDRAIATSRPA
jgi:hypothetical protein